MRPTWPSPPRGDRYLGELGVVALAGAAWIGAWSARPVPVLVGVGVVLVAVARQRPWLLVVGTGLCASSLGAAAWAGLVPVSDGPYAGSVLFVSDPGDAAGAVRADVKLDDGRRVELWARGGGAGVVRDALAGERMPVRGELEPPPPDAPWLAVRHVVGRLVVDTVGGAPEPNDLPARLANGYRRTLVTGAYALPTDLRPLFLGFVLGDDRGQDPALVDDFRGSGLTHLLVVSGQNVAFLLLIARPVLSRMTVPLRLVATVTVLVWFAMLTRFEPSVLRATAMAAVSAWVVFRGGRASPIRVLAVAVTALLLIDPLLHASVGFQLSVGASGAIVVLARRIGAALPGPRPVAEALGVTLAAQAGVAPVQVLVFGGIPSASLIANLVAVPVAGPVMMWGLTGGAAAGVLGPVADGWVSRLLHAPTRLLLWWVAAVARWSATVPLGVLGIGSVLALTGAMAVVLVVRRGRWFDPRWLGGVASVVAAVAVLAPAVAVRAPSPGPVDLGGDATLWRSGGATVVVVSRASALPTDVLEGVRRRGIGRIDLYVSASGGRTAASLLAIVRSRVDVGTVWQPVNGVVPSGSTPVVGAIEVVGDLLVEVGENDPKLAVAVRARR